ncbi:hypothetical protein C8Q75DRAFT_730264 [Abortiporus biennis]|nr:hypothetical protein C8Q75DRAFT_730264 [Abortiporus biennis]
MKPPAEDCQPNERLDKHRRFDNPPRIRTTNPPPERGRGGGYRGRGGGRGGGIANRGGHPGSNNNNTNNRRYEKRRGRGTPQKDRLRYYRSPNNGTPQAGPSTPFPTSGSQPNMNNGSLDNPDLLPSQPQDLGNIITQAAIQNSPVRRSIGSSHSHHTHTPPSATFNNNRALSSSSSRRKSLGGSAIQTRTSHPPQLYQTDTPTPGPSRIPDVKIEPVVEDILPPTPRRLLTQGTTRCFPVPRDCLPPHPKNVENKKSWIQKEVQKLKDLGFTIKKILSRPDGLAIDWESKLPVWSDTLHPESTQGASDEYKSTPATNSRKFQHLNDIHSLDDKVDVQELSNGFGDGFDNPDSLRRKSRQMEDNIYRQQSILHTRPSTATGISSTPPSTLPQQSPPRVSPVVAGQKRKRQPEQSSHRTTSIDINGHSVSDSTEDSIDAAS